MGKGARMRAIRKQANLEVAAFLAKPENRKAMNRAIDQQFEGLHYKLQINEMEVMLWALHEIYGFGPKRLKRFYDNYDRIWKGLRDQYEMESHETHFIAHEKLKLIGVNMEEWLPEKEE